MAYHDAAMEMQYPNDAPSLTQPSQTIFNDDTPLTVTVKQIHKSKVVDNPKLSKSKEVAEKTKKQIKKSKLGDNPKPSKSKETSLEPFKVPARFWW